MKFDYDFETRLIHHGHEPDSATGALATPIYQTATFAAKSVEHFEQLCEEYGYIYSRECNPTLTELELKMAMLEEGESAIVTASGISAISSTLLTLLKSGDHIISSQGIFSHTKILMEELLQKFGVEVTFVDASNPENISSAMRENTKAVYVETPLNPSLELVDISSVSKKAKENGALLIVDSTFAPPPIQRPLSLGADICIHSLTKYINGHGDSLGGAVIGPKELIDKIKWPGMPCFTGASLTPMNAWMIIRGIKTLDMRVKKHCENALSIAEFLDSHEHVEVVNYPALKSHPQHELCKVQMNGMGGGVISFRMKDGINGLTRNKASRRFLNSLRLCTIAASLGEEHTLTYLTGNDLIRVAIGLESADDIISDMKQAFGSV